MAQVPEDVGCNNEICKERDNCQRNFIAKKGTAREVKTFGGTEDKGCGKFIELKK